MAERVHRNRRMEALRNTAAALHRVGTLDEATMRDLEALCLARMRPVSAEDFQISPEREG
jgi:DNA-binding transcriptional regulator YiaG